MTNIVRFTLQESSLTLVIASLVVVGLGIVASAYALRSLRRGRRTEAKVAKLGGTVFLGRWFMEAGYWVMRSPGRFLARRGVKPDTLTWTSLVLTVASAPVAAMGHFSTAGILFVVGAAFDALDGMVARETKTASRAGAMLDSVLDRYADAAPLVGLVLFYRFSTWQMLIPLLAILGGQLVSYVRAKSEAMGLDLPSGLMRRHERVAYLGTALILAPVLSPLLGTPGGAVHPATLTLVALVGIVSNIAAFRLLGEARRALTAASTVDPSDDQGQTLRRVSETGTSR